MQPLTLQFQAGVEPMDAFEQAVEVLGEHLGLDVSHEDLEKAVPAEAHHYQHRAPTGRFAVAHPGRVNPRDARGRFRQRLLQEECQAAYAQAQRYVGELTERMQFATDLLRRERVTRGEWEAMCERDIRTYYDLMYRAGKQSVGDPGIILTRQDRSVLDRIIRDELDFLKAFGQDVASGAGSMDYGMRAELYGRQSREVFWVAWSLGDQRKGRAIRWIYGDTIRHCGDCERFSKMGWMSASRFIKEILSKGKSPQSGALECVGINCRCYLRERVSGVEREPRYLAPAGGYTNGQ